MNRYLSTQYACGKYAHKRELTASAMKEMQLKPHHDATVQLSDERNKKYWGEREGGLPYGISAAFLRIDVREMKTDVPTATCTRVFITAVSRSGNLPDILLQLNRKTQTVVSPCHRILLCDKKYHTIYKWNHDLI